MGGGGEGGVIHLKLDVQGQGDGRIWEVAGQGRWEVLVPKGVKLCSE